MKCISSRVPTRRVLDYLQPRYEHLAHGDQQRVEYLQELLPKMEVIRDVAYRREILGEHVPPEDKLFSLYEEHTEMIVKGKGNVLFGRKASFASGRSELILQAAVLEGMTDGESFEPTLEDVIASYQTVPRDVATDGAYASRHNQDVAQELGVKNIVFNKVVGSLQNITHEKTRKKHFSEGSWSSGSSPSGGTPRRETTPVDDMIMPGKLTTQTEQDERYCWKKAWIIRFAFSLFRVFRVFRGLSSH